MTNLNKLREEIDQIDDQIMSLLEKRYNITNEIGKIKQLQKTTVLDINREKYIFDKTSKYSHLPQIESVYKTIMEESRKAQKKV
jgi:monofunctional chorismate mutase